MKKFETFFILCSTENNGETGQGIYTGDSGEGENDTTDVEQTDPLAEADSALEEDENKGGESSSESTNQENNSTEGAVPIDPVECVAEGNSNPEEEEIVDDPNWGMEDTQDEQEEKNPEEEELIQNAEEENVEETELNKYMETFQKVTWDNSSTNAERLAFYEIYSKLPKALQNIPIKVQFDKTLSSLGKQEHFVITFRDIYAMRSSITEEFIHAYQEKVKGWDTMLCSRSEMEFQAKLVTYLNGWCDQNDNDMLSFIHSDYYVYKLEFFRNNCFEQPFPGAQWQDFDMIYFLDNYMELFNIFCNYYRNDPYYGATPNPYFNWDWDYLLRIFFN